MKSFTPSSCCGSLLPLLLLMAMIMISPSSSAFIFGEPMARHPQLTEFLQLQTDLRLALHLDIFGTKNGNNNNNNNNYWKQQQDQKESSSSAPRLVIQKMILDFLVQPSPSHSAPLMPGANGQHPELSGGRQQLAVVQPGQFVTTQGTQYVEPTLAGWELVWKKDAHAGSLLLGFELPRDYQRGGIDSSTTSTTSTSTPGAKLSQGTIYLNFPVWSPEGLATAQAAQTKARKRAQECAVERDYELLKLKQTANPLKKAWHYRNAYAAVETIHLQPLQHYQDIVPSSEDEMIRLPGDLILTTKGFVWNKQLPRGPQSLLGTAQLAQVV